MSKRYRPLTCCDRDCAGANHCGAMGGVQCPDCGMWYCPTSEGDDEGRCDDCAERHRLEMEEEELGEQEDEDGE